MEVNTLGVTYNCLTRQLIHLLHWGCNMLVINHIYTVINYDLIQLSRLYPVKTLK